MLHTSIVVLVYHGLTTYRPWRGPCTLAPPRAEAEAHSELPLLGSGYPTSKEWLRLAGTLGTALRAQVGGMPTCMRASAADDRSRRGLTAGGAAHYTCQPWDALAWRGATNGLRA